MGRGGGGGGGGVHAGSIGTGRGVGGHEASPDLTQRRLGGYSGTGWYSGTPGSMQTVEYRMYTRDSSASASACESESATTTAEWHNMQHASYNKQHACAYRIANGTAVDRRSRRTRTRTCLKKSGLGSAAVYTATHIDVPCPRGGPCIQSTSRMSAAAAPSRRPWPTHEARRGTGPALASETRSPCCTRPA